MIFRTIDAADLENKGSYTYFQTLKRLRELKSIDQVVIQEEILD